MNKLVNYAISNGIYKELETELDSNKVEVSLTDNLSIYKAANKIAWADDKLNYSITINNPTLSNCTDIIITDILNPLYITLVTESVRINDVPAAFGTILYDSETGTFTINLPVINSLQTIRICFQVKKKRDEGFVLNNYATLTFQNDTIVSNEVKVTAFNSVCKCKANKMNLEWKIKNKKKF